MTRDETPAEFGRRLATEHAATRPLTPEQIEAAARILATVEPARSSAEPRAA